ncbi:phosphopantetheine-binding protein [Candidatus Magnetominusculus dajiuhuensis]|uniref:phosphopantetheine-binding protein n=1 Tax=Candidatus Magnetominusculus dajiuhuensis TaxID=3137712 RepID=UPI003B42E16F
MRQTLISDDKVIEELKKAAAETLAIDVATIKADSSLVKDLGAESLDFLDINYRVEQTFAIKMARHFIIEHIEEMFGEGTALDADGRLTEKAVNLMRIRLDTAVEGSALEALKPGMDMDALPAMITIRSMAGSIMDILDTLPENCTECGKSAWKTENGTRIVCGACGAEAAYKNGDDLIKEWLQKTQDEHKII